MTEFEDVVAKAVAMAAVADPSIEPAAATAIARACFDVLLEEPASTTADLARECVVRCPDADTSWVNHIARAAHRLASEAAAARAAQ